MAIMRKISLLWQCRGQDEYELIYYDGDGQVLQQIPCGRLTEPVTFSYDGLAYGTWDNLEIFSDGSDTGLLFIWKNDRFSTEPIKLQYGLCDPEHDKMVVKKFSDRNKRKEKSLPCYLAGTGRLIIV